jgi:endoribonuclease Dicer
MTGGRETALKVTKALRIPILGIEQWSDFGRKVLAPPPKYTAKMRPGSIVAIQSIIGHKISRPHLLAQALVRFNWFRDRDC